MLWDKSRGADKGLGGSGASPIVLVTRNPNVRSIKDFTRRTGFPVPAIKTSTQAMILAMAAESLWGPGNHARLDGLTVTRAHPDAVAALLDPRSEINSHFSLPPYLNRELATPGGARRAGCRGGAGAPFVNGMLIASQAYHDQNRPMVQATVGALDDALALIR